MVDREARRAAALLIRQLYHGEITNDDFHVGWPRNSSDRALRAIGFTLNFAISENITRPLEFGEDGRTHLERCALFLDSNLEYEWPRDRFYTGGKAPRLAFVLTLGLYLPFYIWLRRRYLEQEAARDSTVWPFIRRSDYEQERDRRKGT
jgi:hypothetical protein